MKEPKAKKTVDLNFKKDGENSYRLRAGRRVGRWVFEMRICAFEAVLRGGSAKSGNFLVRTRPSPPGPYFPVPTAPRDQMSRHATLQPNSNPDAGPDTTIGLSRIVCPPLFCSQSFAGAIAAWSHWSTVQDCSMSLVI